MSPTDLAATAAALIESRQTTLPKRLVAPGPDEAQLALILKAAASAPDHDRLLPWRFVIVSASGRDALAEVFADALVERDAQATDQQRAQAREKAHRAPLLMLAIVDGQRGNPGVDLHERIVSAGCAIQNMLLMATALGFGSGLTSGKALKAPGLRRLFELSAGEHALCFISVGTVQAGKPRRERPCSADYVSTLRSRPPSAVIRPLHLSPAAGFEAPFDMLQACHERVQRMLALLAKLRQHLVDNGLDDAARQAARDVMRYFDIAAPLHHEDEELHVFPALIAGSDTAMKDLALRLIRDHRQMEQAWSAARQLLGQLAEAATPWQPWTAAQTEHLDRFARLYEAHLQAEDQLAYPAARLVLDPSALQAMSADMMGRRGVVPRP